MSKLQNFNTEIHMLQWYETYGNCNDGIKEWKLKQM